MNCWPTCRPNFDYIDIAGGCGMLPRTDIAPVHGSFYRIDPPSTRTACCAIIARKFAARLVTPAPPDCVLPIDWALNVNFVRIAAEIYWVEPTVFEHGSEINAYRSWTKEPNFSASITQAAGAGSDSSS